ncbi:hypothetical protein PG994_013330 [Apiospora phragmitis]|uniref:Uncharacterized protein n=1 Tax=Apiospora phragmitis TaxID=2905665 RepID=A0ABR1T8V1_9PEZI
MQNLSALEVSEPKEDEDGGHISLGDERKKFWADMPGLGDAWDDNLIAYQATFYDSKKWKLPRRGRMLKPSLLDWFLYMMSASQATLLLTSPSYAVVHVLERDAHPLAALELRAAVSSFRVGVTELLRLRRAECRPEPSCALGEGFDDVQGLKGRGGKFLWTGAGGYSLERWAFWKERWQELDERRERDEDRIAVLEAISNAEKTRLWSAVGYWSQWFGKQTISDVY